MMRAVGLERQWAFKPVVYIVTAYFGEAGTAGSVFFSTLPYVRATGVTRLVSTGSYEIWMP